MLEEWLPVPSRDQEITGIVLQGFVQDVPSQLLKLRVQRLTAHEENQ
jgi:hypothetical protein